MTSPPQLVHELEQRVGDRAGVKGCRALLGQRLEHGDEARLVQEVALLEERAAGRIDASPFVHRHHRGEHLQARRLRGRHRHALDCESHGRLDEPSPGEAAVRGPERAETCRKAGNPARGDADGVVHQLLAERHLELDQLGVTPFAAEPGDGDEAVEVRRRSGAGIVVDAVAAAQEAGHHGLGHA